MDRNIGRLRINAEWDGGNKWLWKPFWKRIVEHDAYRQKFWNYKWHLSCGWLRFWVQVTWEKG